MLPCCLASVLYRHLLTPSPLHMRTGHKPVRMPTQALPLHHYGRVGRVAIKGVALRSVVLSRDNMRCFFEPQL